MPSTKKFRFTDKNGNTIEVDIGAEGENVTIDGQKLTDLLDEMIEKQTTFTVDTFTSNSGSNYVATVDGLTEYKGGMLLIFSPNVTSTSKQPYLNINGLGNKRIVRRFTAGMSSYSEQYINDNFYVGFSYLLQYDGNSFIDVTRPQTSWQDVSGKPTTFTPSSHASSSTTYGAGTSSNYGHVRLSDSTSSTSGVSGGTAATPAAVKAAYDKANIKKNSDSDTGDIISTHLTVGTRRSGSNIGANSFTSGSNNAAIGNYSVAIGGSGNKANSNYSAIFGGVNCETNDTQSVVLGGAANKANGVNSAVIGGNGNEALANQLKIGHYSKDGTAGNTVGTTGDVFIIGNGSSDFLRSNAFRVAYNGSVYALSTFNSTGADYAELLEWEDGNTDNADRRGLFVTWGTNDKIKIASPGDEIVGIISATSSVIGNAYEDSWQGMYLTDAFGQPITQTVHHDAEYVDVYVPDIGNDGGALDTNHVERQLLHEAYDAEEYVINSDYDPTQEYIPRSQRKEWATVGMLGQLIVIDDGTCTVGGRCAVGDNGKATAFESGYKVLKRIDDTHIKIFFK